MRGPLSQPVRGAPTFGDMYESPSLRNAGFYPQIPRSHNNTRSTDYNCLSPRFQNAVSGVPVFEDHWPLHVLASDGMAVHMGSTYNSAAPSNHFQYVDYSHTHCPHEMFHVHYTVAPPSLAQSTFGSGYASQFTPTKPVSKLEQTTQGLLDNETNLEKMRQERRLIFEEAAMDLDQAKRDNGSTVPSNKAWEDAWDTLRERLTKM
ncbi:hypothetical protein QM012_007951 [Aureobasidium pullulans]|uniref:Uncharacterized protein n=1 Tax=Aureobasidium pullulans TaxID=5580 RepID=A0ABR0TLE7_AURPU